MISIFPMPRQIKRLNGTISEDILHCAKLEEAIQSDIPEQGYCLTLHPDGITLAYSSAAGRAYGLDTLSQLRAQTEPIPCMVIKDAPDYPVRGLLLDISRGKVPTLKQLKSTVDLLAKLRYNQLQLYIEGYSFAYPGFEADFPQATPLTPDEIRELDRYCMEKGIELVPNHNTLGHMTAWLALPQYQSLRESDEPIPMMNGLMQPSTFDPNNPDALTLVERLTKELLSCFRSDLFNAGLDEPFDLGRGKTAREVARRGVGPVYADFVRKIYNIAAAHGKKLLLWADMAAKYPEVLELLPKDVTLLEWDYEEGQPVLSHCRKLAEAGFAFYVCPGTSAWTTFTGRTENMYGNIRSAALAGKETGAKGLMLTDWGDQGHLNSPTVSYPGYVYASALAWNTDTAGATQPDAWVAEVLDRLVLQDRNRMIGQLLLDAGRYCALEEFPMFNMTIAALSVLSGPMPKASWEGCVSALTTGLESAVDPDTFRLLQEKLSQSKPFDFNAMDAYLQALSARLHRTDMQTPEAGLICAELENNLRMVRVGSMLRNLILSEGTLSATEQEQTAAALCQLTQTVIEENRRLWVIRNKPGGLVESEKPFVSILEQIRIQKGVER